MRNASALLLRQLRRTHKAPLPFLSGGGSFFRPNLPNPSPHSRSFKTHATFSSDFTKKGFLSRDFSARAHTEYDNKERKDGLLKDLQSAKTNAERMKILEEMIQATHADLDYIGAGAYLFGKALLDEENDPENALTFVEWAVGVYEKGETKRPHKLAVCLNLLGKVYYALNRLNDALECFSRSLGLLDSIKDNDSRVWTTMVSTYLLFSRTEMKNKRCEEAADHLRKSVEIMETKLLEKPKEDIAFSYLDVAKLYVLASNYKEALPCCLKALDFHIELGLDVRVVALVRRSLVKIYSELGEHEKAHEQEELARVLGYSNNDSLDSLIDSAKMLIARRRWLEAMKILEGPLGGAYLVSKQVGGRIDPEVQKKLDEARELWRSCEATGLVLPRFYKEYEDFDLGKDPSTI